jgi:hypothetical protein
VKKKKMSSSQNYQEIVWKENKRVEVRKNESFGYSLVAKKDYKAGDVIINEKPYAFGEGDEDAECYFSFIQRAIGKTIMNIRKTDLRGTTRGNKDRERTRTFADLTVVRELDYDRAILRDELIGNKFYTSMKGHEVLSGGYEVDDIVGIVNRCTLNSFRVKTLERKDLSVAQMVVAEAADLVDMYVEIGDEKTLAVGVFVLASALNHSCVPNAFASFAEPKEEEDNGRAGTSTASRSNDKPEIFTTSEEENKITIRACKPIEHGEEITVSYGPVFHSGNLEERRKALKRTHQFICRCKRCILELQELGENLEQKMEQIKKKQEVVGDLIHNYVESGKYETDEVLKALTKFNMDIRKMKVFGKACFDIAAQLVQDEQFAQACEYQTLALHSLILRCEGIDEDDISIAWEILRLLFVKRLVKLRGNVKLSSNVMKDLDLVHRAKRILKRYHGRSKYPYEMFLQSVQSDPLEVPRRMKKRSSSDGSAIKEEEEESEDHFRDSTP